MIDDDCILIMMNDLQRAAFAGWLVVFHECQYELAMEAVDNAIEAKKEEDEHEEEKEEGEESHEVEFLRAFKTYLIKGRDYAQEDSPVSGGER